MGVHNGSSHGVTGETLWVFENGELKKISGPKWDEVTGERRRLHN